MNITTTTVQAFWEELEKIAYSAQLELRPTPRELGILSRKTGDDDRALAATHNVGATTGAAALSGAAGSAILGTPLSAAVTEKGRRRISAGLAKDVDAAHRAVRGAKRSFIKDVAKATKSKARDVAKNPALIARLPKEQREKVLQRALGTAAGKFKEPALRRLKGAAAGAAVFGLGAGALHALGNLGTYEGTKAMTGRGYHQRKTRMRRGKSKVAMPMTAGLKALRKVPKPPTPKFKPMKANTPIMLPGGKKAPSVTV